MVTKEYSIAYVQVLEVLKGLSRKEFRKIPKERIELYEDNKDKNYKFELDKTRNFNEQISDVAQSILGNLFVRYVATPEDRNEIYNIEKEKFIKQELEKRNNLVIKPLFEKKEEPHYEEIKKEESLTIIEEKGIFKKLINKIKNYFSFWKK